ncbi:MAG: GldG family protein, partial [Myxococcota bacterium]
MKADSQTATTALGIAFLVAIIVMVNYLSFRHYERWDWTEAQVYTLSERTLQELSSLDRDLEFYVFLSVSEPNYAEVEELLERYRAASSRIDVTFVDPDRDPSQYQVLAERFGVRTGMTQSGESQADIAAVAVSQDARWTITRDDLLSLDYGSFDDGAGPKVDVKAEQALTGAIVQLTTGEPTRVCVSSGHGEWPLSSAAEGSLYTLKDELGRDNIEMETVELLVSAEVPERCTALFVVGPQRAFGPEESAAIDAHLRRGGHLLLALDPILERLDVQPTGLEGLLGEIGIRLGRSVVLEVDASRVLPPGDPSGPFVVATYGDHPTTRGLSLAGAPTLFARVQSVRAVDGAGGTDLLLTSADSWAETDLRGLDPAVEPAAGPDDEAGPVSIATAVEVGEEEARVIVVGDADWLQSQPLQDPRFANLDLAIGWAGWLTQRDTLIAIQPKQIDAQPMMITEEDLGDLMLRLLVFMPG